ncbi:hypothetical protein AAHB51_12290 [Bacillus cereus]
MKRGEKREAFICSEIGDYNFIKYATLKYSQKESKIRTFFVDIFHKRNSTVPSSNLNLLKIISLS